MLLYFYIQVYCQKSMSRVQFSMCVGFFILLFALFLAFLTFTFYSTDVLFLYLILFFSFVSSFLYYIVYVYINIFIYFTNNNKKNKLKNWQNEQLIKHNKIKQYICIYYCILIRYYQQMFFFWGRGGDIGNCKQH